MVQAVPLGSELKRLVRLVLGLEGVGGVWAKDRPNSNRTRTK